MILLLARLVNLKYMAYIYKGPKRIWFVAIAVHNPCI
jgi:hypothetical protein